MILWRLHTEMTSGIRNASLSIAALLICAGGAARAETPEQWVKLLTRVHGGFGSFLPVGIRIGEDAMKRLNAKPRELSVVFYQGEGVPCPCPADGVMLAVGASPGQGTLQVAAEKSPPGTFAVVVIRPRKGGDGLKYTVPISFMPKLGQINSTIQDPLGALQRGDGAARPVHRRAGEVARINTKLTRKRAHAGFGVLIFSPHCLKPHIKIVTRISYTVPHMSGLTLAHR